MFRILISFLAVVLLPITAFCQHFNGSTWDQTTAKRYNGTTWDTVTVNRFNGSTWDDITEGGGAATYTAEVQFTDVEQTGTLCKVCVYDMDDSGNIVSCSDPISVARNSTESASFASLSLTSSHSYKAGIVPNGYVTIYYGGTGWLSYDDTGSYSSPPTPVSTTASGMDTPSIVVKENGSIIIGAHSTASSRTINTNLMYLGPVYAY